MVKLSAQAGTFLTEGPESSSATAVRELQQEVNRLKGIDSVGRPQLDFEMAEL